MADHLQVRKFFSRTETMSPFIFAVIFFFCKVKVRLSRCFNWAPRHGGLLGSGGIAPLILWPWHEMEASGRLHVPVAIPPAEETLVPIG